MMAAAIPAFAALLAAFAAVLPTAAARAVEPTDVAAASDLTFALTEVADLFAAETGDTVRLSFGSSGNFRRQIAQGAPFDLFLSADESYVADLFRDGLTLDQGALYGIGRIVLFAPHGSALRPDPELKDLVAAAADGRLKAFAIANPAHAPYGRAARQALTKAGLWNTIGDRLVLGENATQTAQFATSGSAQGGIIPLSLATVPAVSALGTFALLPETWHDPLRQRMVLLRGADEVARRFYAFLQGDAARSILRRYGFALPGETS